uniref:Phospholipase-like protein n=1 Tax=Tanacetum cinerariifolium TaxID=118510 RepID=A0A6L2JNH4_TANCI|nr:phospholipase-like protein [Tanacetum cinerariifolium]
MATYNFDGFVWASKIWILKSYPNSMLWWTKQPDIIHRGLACAINDHDPAAAAESNKLLEDVDSLFKEVIDGRPDLVGRVDELKTKLVRTLTYNVSPQETEVDNVEIKDTMDVDNEDGKYCLDDMSIGFEEDTSNGEIKEEET